MDFNKLIELPRDIQYIIINYIPFSLIEDKDETYFSVEVFAYQVEGNLQFHVPCWFGINSPQYKNNLRYTIFERPFARELERFFALIGKHIFDTIKIYNFPLDMFSEKTIFQAGKFGPLPLTSTVLGGCTLEPGDHCLFHHQILENDLLDYFKRYQVIDPNIETLDQEKIKRAVDQLVENTKTLIIESLQKFNHFSNNSNQIGGPIYREDEKNKMFFRLKKAFPDSHQMLKKNIKREIKRYQNYWISKTIVCTL